MKLVENTNIAVKAESEELDKAITILNNAKYEIVAVVAELFYGNGNVMWYRIFAKRFK